jgi:hypothetical protein
MVAIAASAAANGVALAAQKMPANQQEQPDDL